jgi:hypothetical protein
MNTTCPCCYGEGAFMIEEEGNEVCSPCYHCQTTGKISQEQRDGDRAESLAYTLAEDIVQKWKIGLSKDGDCEGVAFLAAEYGIGERQYIEDCIYKEAQDIMGELSRLKPATLNALLNLVDNNK